MTPITQLWEGGETNVAFSYPLPNRFTGLSLLWESEMLDCLLVQLGAYAWGFLPRALCQNLEISVREDRENTRKLKILGRGRTTEIFEAVSKG